MQPARDVLVWNARWLRRAGERVGDSDVGQPSHLGQPSGVKAAAKPNDDRSEDQHQCQTQPEGGDDRAGCGRLVPAQVGAARQRPAGRECRLPVDGVLDRIEHRVDDAMVDADHTGRPAGVDGLEHLVAGVLVGALPPQQKYDLRLCRGRSIDCQHAAQVGADVRLRPGVLRPHRRSWFQPVLALERLLLADPEPRVLVGLAEAVGLISLPRGSGDEMLREDREAGQEHQHPKQPGDAQPQHPPICGAGTGQLHGTPPSRPR